MQRKTKTRTGRRAIVVKPVQSRWTPNRTLPAGTIPCPLCKTEMKIDISAMTQYHCISGPYCRASVVFICSDDRCGFRDRVSANSASSSTFTFLEELAQQLASDLQSDGWHDKKRRKASKCRVY